MTATFVVETGSGLSNANSFQSVEGADQYNDDHNQDSGWSAALSSAKEKALRLATQYLVATYEGRWRGQRASCTQALSWPRYDWQLDTYLNYGSASTMPQALLDATSELAIRSLNGTVLMRDVAAADSGAVVDDLVQIGPLKFEQKFSEAPAPYDTFTAVERILSSLLYSDGMMVRG